ncbi:hypothetical protein [Methyloceanibacter sp.]|uniref:hypothetical protein n=1 Tax=Methyloceanibacter sp. TaxID=1965321 RepID=UPI003D6CE53C
MRLTATVCVALAASLCVTFEHASAQSCPDDGNKLLSSFSEAKDALKTKGCSELDQFISARTLYADFLDTALAKGCSEFYVALNRILLSETYKNPPADCGAAWQAKGDNRQLQYDAIAVLNRDIGPGVFDGDAIVLKQQFWHEDNHTVGLAIRKCRKKGANAAFAIQCAEGSEPSESSDYRFDVTLIDPQRIDVMERSALTVETINSANTPEEYVRTLTRRGTTWDATRIVLHCLPDAVHQGGWRRGEHEPCPALLRSRGQLQRCALAYRRRARDDAARAALILPNRRETCALSGGRFPSAISTSCLPTKACRHWRRSERACG